MLIPIFVLVLASGNASGGIMVKQESRDSPQIQSREHLFYGDIVLTPLQRLSMNRTKLGYSAIKGVRKRWKGAVIPYEIDCSIENLPEAVLAIKRAMAQWQRKTCIRFIKHTTEEYHLKFFRSTNCWGNIGQVKDASLSVGHGCEYDYVMAHELGHIIGLHHEHNREDRDQYVQVNWGNIGRFKDAFDIVHNTESFGIPYDYSSIMHYPWNAFSGNGKETMQPIQPTYGKVPYVEISEDDAELVTMMYNCREVERRRRRRRRWRRLAKRESNELNCVDTKEDCPYWKQWGHCYIQTVINACPKSCNPACQAPTEAPTKQFDTWPNRNYLGTGQLCLDFSDTCEYGASIGECKRRPRYMFKECMKSCKKLGFDVPCEVEPIKPPGECANPLGLAYDGTGNHKIPDSAFYAPNMLRPGREWEAPPHAARLYNEENYDINIMGAWCSSSDVEPEYLQVDLGRRMKVTYIATQGRPKYFERVSKFKIRYGDSGYTSDFVTYKENGFEKLFVGNCDHRTPILNKFNTPIVARFIRYVPIEWNYPCVRMELYGC